jgi:hypothetical protein
MTGSRSRRKGAQAEPDPFAEGFRKLREYAKAHPEAEIVPSIGWWFSERVNGEEVAYWDLLSGERHEPMKDLVPDWSDVRRAIDERK